MITDWKPQLLEDHLIKLIPLQNSDFESLYEVASDPLIWEQHPSSDRYKREVFENYFNSFDFWNSPFLIFDTEKDKIIGSTRYYEYKPENPSIAIGYTFLSRAYWGGHYNKSVKKLLIDYAFQFVDKVYFHIAPINIRSQKAIQKIGAIKIGLYVLASSGKNLIYDEYCIERDRWTSNNLLLI